MVSEKVVAVDDVHYMFPEKMFGNYGGGQRRVRHT